MALPSPYNLKAWIEENRHLLKPPVGNKMVWKDGEFLVMVVGGPNRRKDYHVEDGEEFFLQIEGDITVRVMEDGGPRDITIREGEIFLLPAGVPHSPQRPENTVGMDAAFQLEDLATQLKPIIENFFEDESLRTCKSCDAVMQPPTG
jgi:3-hydroxyanthranilate 3,4-dioxygenase